MPRKKRLLDAVKFAAILVLLFLIASPALAGSDDPMKSFLQQNYLQKTVVAAVPNLAVSYYQGQTFVGQNTPLLYHHFAEGVELPKVVKFPLGQGWAAELKKLDQLDPQTWVHKAKNNLPFASVNQGGAFIIRGVEVKDKYIDLMLEAKATAEQGAGMRFRFYFQPEVLNAGQTDVVASEIGKYFMSEQQVAKAVAVESNIELAPGDTEEAILKKLGPPLKTVSFGGQKTLQYASLTAVLKDGKLMEVKVQ